MDLKRWVERSIFEWDERWSDVAQVIGLSVGAVALTTACSVGLDWQSRPQRIMRVVATVGGISLSLTATRQGRELARLSTLYECRQKFRIEAAKAIATAEVANITNPAYNAQVILKPFDWQALRDTVEFPHIAITGKTGQGKSTLAEYLCTLLGGGVIAVAPHYEPGDFPSADLIVGTGRDYGGAVASEPSIDWADIMAGQLVSVSGFIKSLHGEMTQRYRGDRSSCQPVNVILDEFNAYAKLDGLGELIKQLIREGRKVGIRLMLLCHGVEVKALGIEGEGSLRMSLTQILLGNFAKEFAKTKQNKCKLHSEDFLEWRAKIDFLTAEKRPCLVGDDIALIPSLAPGSIPVNSAQRILGQSVQEPAQRTPPVKDVQFLESCLAKDCTPAHTCTSCPKCGSDETRTSGTLKSGKTRYRCNTCGKTWS